MSENGFAGGNQFIAFRLYKELYAFEIDQVQEIIKFITVTRVPRSPSSIQGVINLRGNIVPVMDLRRRLGLQVSDMTESSRIIVAVKEGIVSGFIVDEVTEVITIPDEQIEAAPKTFSDDCQKHVRGIGKDADRLLIILHINTLMDFN